MSTASTSTQQPRPQASANEALSVLAAINRQGGVSVLGAAETEIEEKEKAMRELLRRDVEKRNGFFVVNIPERPKEDEE